MLERYVFFPFKVFQRKYSLNTRTFYKYVIRYFMRFFICINVTPWKLWRYTVSVQNITKFDINLLLNYTQLVWCPQDSHSFDWATSRFSTVYILKFTKINHLMLFLRRLSLKMTFIVCIELQCWPLFNIQHDYMTRWWL